MNLPHNRTDDTTGPPKLQQAYLNIINMIFAGEVLSPPPSSSSSLPPSPHPSSRNHHLDSHHDPPAFSPTPSAGEASPGTVAVDRVLHSLREHILRAPSILPSLVRLIDQGGSSAVRGKALITAQLLCRQSPGLLAIFLGERRLPPGDRDNNDNSDNNDNNDNTLSNSSYSTTSFDTLTHTQYPSQCPLLQHPLALVRVIEPYISRADSSHQLVGGPGFGPGSPSKLPSRALASALPLSGGGAEGVVTVVEPSYVEKAALSMVMFLREGNDDMTTI